MNQVRLLLTFGMLMMLGACTLGPNYVRPELVVPMAFKEAAGWKAAEPRDEVTRGAWWELFADATLNDLVSQVEVSNQNIRTGRWHGGHTRLPMRRISRGATGWRRGKGRCK